MARDPFRVLSLFSGGGGLDLAVGLAIRNARTVCYVEGDIQAARVLAARMEAGDLDPAPVWSDVRTFDGAAFRGRVDLIHGGFPCQDISVAGKGAGIGGEKSGLWGEYARIIREVRPRLVFIENVAALTSRGLDRVLGDLAELGFDAEWTTVSAGACGAPHRRNRIFILGHTTGKGLEWAAGGGDDKARWEKAGPVPGCEGLADPDRWRGRERAAQRKQIGRDVVGSNGEELANTERDSVRAEQGRREPGRAGEAEPRHTGEDVADTDGGGRELKRVGGLLDGQREARGDDPDRRSLWPTGHEDQEGGGRGGGARPAIRRGVDGMAGGLGGWSRVDQLRILGNGVVPIQGAVAFTLLLQRLHGGAVCAKRDLNL